MRGKLIVIEGTDCSGKETQTNLLISKLRSEGLTIEEFSFPNYNSPTGKIIAGPYLGKPHVGEGWFPEGAPNVDPKVASLYYATDRLYNISKINFLLDQGINIVVDRYTYSNMAHQAGKLKNEIERRKMYEWCEKLEFELLGLPKPDICILLYLPYENGEILRKNRLEKLDQLENDKSHLLDAQRAYLEIAERYGFKIINCAKGDGVRTINSIHNDIYEYINYEFEKVMEPLF